MFGIKRYRNGLNEISLAPPRPPSRQRFELDQPLLSFSPKDHWTLRDACQGTQIMGGTGSGKTSGTGRAIAMAFLRAGFGGLVLCAKPGESALWRKYARETGREKSLIVFGDDGSRRFNFLDYELRRGDRLVTHNLVSLFMRIMEVAKAREGKGGGTMDFWNDAVSELLSNAFLVLYSAWGQVTMGDLMNLISSAPRTEAQADKDEWRQRSFCFQSLVKMVKDPVHRLPETDAVVAGNFFRVRWAGAADKMRSGIEFTLSSLASPFLTGYLRELFCTTTNILPEFTHEGAILVIDLPIKQHGEAGILGQHIWKYLWQRATERRDGDRPTARPVFLWADECQFFLSKYDAEFQSTARSSKACTVYMTQSLPAYLDRLGAGSEHTVNALLNNFQTRIFHQNMCPVTNQHAADLIGEVWMTVKSYGANTGTSDSDSRGINQSGGGGASYGNGQSSTSSSWSNGRNRTWSKTWTTGTSENYVQQVQHEVLPSTFARLRQGGRGGAPQAIIVQGGRVFAHNHRPYLMCEFQQG